jgi:hypothetical protein
MLVMLQSNPGLVAAGDTNNQEAYHRRRSAAANGLMGEIEEGFQVDDLTSALPASFTYIPDNQQDQYGLLLRRCLSFDLDMMATLPEDEEVSLGILSARHLELLSECAIRWRITPAWRHVVLLDAMLSHFSQGSVPFECLIDAFEGCVKLIAEVPVRTWAIKDVSVRFYAHYLQLAKRPRRYAT